MSNPGVFLSESTLTLYGSDIRQACGSSVVPQFIVHEPAVPLDELTQSKIEIAFLSTEMIGQNGVSAPDAMMNAFFDTLRSASRLRWLHVCSAGTDRPIFKELAGRGVVITNSSGANAKAVAHTAMTGMLALARDVPLWVRSQGQCRWQPQRHEKSPIDIDGTTAVIVGLGTIGREIARLCNAFGIRVLGVRRNAQPVDGCDEVHPLAGLPNLLKNADWLILACPLTEETRSLVDASLLARLPARARVINVSRGAVVDENALLEALENGALAGAYSDVFATEPLPASSPLWRARNFLISAHSAGSSMHFNRNAAVMFIQNLKRWTNGQPLINLARF